MIQLPDVLCLAHVYIWRRHELMTVMTDDSFLNLRGKEALVNIYYNIYNTNMNHPQIFNNCHLSSVIIESVKIAHPARYRRKVIFEARKLRIRRLEITVRSISSNSC